MLPATDNTGTDLVRDFGVSQLRQDEEEDLQHAVLLGQEPVVDQMGGHQVLVVVTRGVHVVHYRVEADDHDVLGLLSYDDLTTQPTGRSDGWMDDRYRREDDQVRSGQSRHAMMIVIAIDRSMLIRPAE